MKDMLKRIIEMDEQARLVKVKAIEEKAATEIEIKETKQNIYNDYIERAKERVKKNLEVDKANAQKNWEQTAKDHQKALNDLDNMDKENHDLWVSEIVNNVIG